MLLLMITTDCAAVMILCIAECGAKHALTQGDDGLGWTELFLELQTINRRVSRHEIWTSTINAIINFSVIVKTDGLMDRF